MNEREIIAAHAKEVRRIRRFAPINLAKTHRVFRIMLFENDPISAGWVLRQIDQMKRIKSVNDFQQLDGIGPRRLQTIKEKIAAAK